MDTRNGDIYDSPEAARRAGVPERDVAAISGTIGQVMRMSAAMKAQAEEEKGLVARERQRRRHASDHPAKATT